jgi:hypothetical protein
MQEQSTTIAGTPDELKAQSKKLSARAMNLKMELHDLSEELPQGWERIPEVAQRTFEAFEALSRLRAQLAAQGS